MLGSVTTAQLLARHADEWRAAIRGRFLQALGDGSLADHVFRAWLSQDYLFVSDLLRFQARLLSVAPRDAQAVLAGGLVGLEAELAWFEGHARRLGVSFEVQRQAVTAAYARLLADCSDDWPRGITALWAGERAYLEAWRGVGRSDSPYAEFVEHWTQPEFALYVENLAALADSAGADEPTFLAVCDLERDFWAMAWDSAPS